MLVLEVEEASSNLYGWGGGGAVVCFGLSRNSLLWGKIGGRCETTAFRQRSHFTLACAFGFYGSTGDSI